jgi:aspartyl-tRNA(Asn)/glutamyl-tRNA(Gln) amidotransferase subunit A
MYQLSASALHELFVKGEISAEQIVDMTFSRIAHFEPKVGAFLSLFSEKARKKAQVLDQKRSRGEKLGKLAGVTIAFKDNINVLGEKTTCGSQFLSNYTSVFDATATRLIESEDALIIGKTNMDEFAMGSSTENSSFHLTKNPWDLTCSPGGSSGGSAAAVAARFCPLSLGSDTGGSIRQPAAFCGVVGFKPSYGRISRHGLVAFGSSLDQIGPLSYHVADAALLFDIMAKPCRYDSTSIPHSSPSAVEAIKHPPKGLKIGVPWHFLEKLDPDTRQNFEASIEIFKSLGHTVVDINLELLKYSIAVYYILATAEASTNLARFDGVRYGKRSPRAVTLDEIFDFSREEGFGPEVKRRIMLGTYVLSAGYQDDYYKKAQKVRTLIIQQYKKAFEECNMIATPTSPFTAFKLGEIQDPLQMYLQDIYTIPANLAGLPAISMPSGFCTKGTPFALHLTGPFLHDTEVLAAAAQFEKALPSAFKIPPQFQGSSHE